MDERPAMRIALFRGKWHVYIGAGPTRQRLSLRTADRDQADRALADLLREQAQVRGGTVSDIMGAYIADRKQTGKSTATVNFSWKALKPTFGALYPEQIIRELCRTYAEKRRAGKRGNGTILRELGTLKAALRWQNKNTPAVFEMPPTPAARETHITKAEFIHLREAAAKTPHLAVFIELAKATGARAGAILELPWTRIDFERGLVRLGPDVGGKRRATVPMVDSLRAVLMEAKEAALSPYVVEYGGAQIGSIKTAFRRMAKAIGRQDVGPHTIRHSVAVWMAEDGISMSEIAQYLGHTNSKITEKHYARFSPAFLRRAASVVDF